MLKINTLNKHRAKIFFESGSYQGDGIQCALTCGFEKIYSCEVDVKNYSHCVWKDYFNPKNAELYIEMSDSSKFFEKYLKRINEKVTFWLDAHFSGEGTSFCEVWCPLIKELDVIKTHHIKNHTILIDDRRLFGTSEFNNITENEIKNKVLEINPEYKFSYDDGYQAEDILICQI